MFINSKKFLFISAFTHITICALIAVVIVNLASLINTTNDIKLTLDEINASIVSIESILAEMQDDKVTENISDNTNTNNTTKPHQLTITVEDLPDKQDTVESESVPTPELLATLISDTRDITKVSNATAEELNAAIKATCKWMYEYNPNIGEVYARLEQEYGINAYFALAVSFSEVGVGEMSNLAKNNKNTYGIMNGKKYDSVEDCVDYFFRLIKKHYVGQGLTTVEDISQKYCLGDPVWIKNVTVFMRKLPERSRL